WNTDVHVPFVLPVEQLLTFVSIAVYWLLSLQHYQSYQAWLEHSVSDREDHHIEWVRNFLIALGLTLILWVALVVWDRWVAKLNYFEQFPFYLWLAILAYYLGTEGYRHARHSYPLWQQVSHSGSTAYPVRASMPLAAVPVREGVDISLRAHKWRERLVQEEWWRDPELSLQSLARHLGTNTSDLSRAINEGMGQNFNELINRMRVDAVKAALVHPHQSQGLLELAFAAGFSSKASFNRCFKLYTGQTPSAYRQSVLPTV
ncbi:MAG: AraC family transcriptional regulator, partial [Burkholderiales bacterium PBB4]